MRGELLAREVGHHCNLAQVAAREAFRHPGPETLSEIEKHVSSLTAEIERFKNANSTKKGVPA